MTTPTSEPCSEERLEDLLRLSRDLPSSLRLALIEPGELAWLVDEARRAASLGRSLSTSLAEVSLLRGFEARCLEIVESDIYEGPCQAVLLEALDNLNDAREGLS